MDIMNTNIYIIPIQHKATRKVKSPTTKKVVSITVGIYVIFEFGHAWYNKEHKARAISGPFHPENCIKIDKYMKSPL